MNWVMLAAPVGGGLLVGGVVALVMGLRPGPAGAAEGRARLSWRQRWARWTRRPPGALGRRRDLLLGIGLLAGVVGFVLTRWIALVVLVPIGMAILPKLLGQAPPSDLPLLGALDRWVRTVATSLGSGSDVIDAIRNSQSSTPALIAGEVGTLIDRFNSGWPSDAAFHRFADDLDSPEADAVVASLALAAHHSNGVGDNLRAIADSIQDRIRVTRTIEVERGKPRQGVRLTTIITAIMIAVAVFVGRGYFASLATPLGQLLLAGLAAGYVASLLAMYRMTVPRRRDRIFTTPTQVR